MKHLRSLFYLLLTAVLSVGAVLPVHAQQEQDALYVYRNDGEFNAFFYGDIRRITYSKIDTLGVEQDDYVVQEVWTADTVVRIPVSAIDSVSFVTPETKYKEGVFVPDQSFVSYIIASDAISWIRLASWTPQELIPKVGDKLYIPDDCDLIPDGFSGLVERVETTDEGITVTVSPIEIEDVFEWLVIKVAGSSQPGADAARRRGILSGYAIETPEFNLPVPNVTGAVTLKKSTAFLPEGDVEINGDLSGSGAVAFEFNKATTRVFLTITPFTGLQYYQESFYDMTSTLTLGVSGGLSARAQLPLKKLEFHEHGLKFELSAGLFLEGSVTGLQLSWANQRREHIYTKTSFTDTDILMGTKPFVAQSIKCVKDTSNWSFQALGQYSIGMGGYAKFETSFKGFFRASDKPTMKIEAVADAGTKLDFKAPVWDLLYPQTALYDWLSYTSSIYDQLNVDNDISVSIYGKLSFAFKYKDWGVDYTPELTLFQTDPLSLVPDISGIAAEYDTKTKPYRPYRVKISSPVRRNLFMPVDLGFLVLNEAKDSIVEDYCELPYGSEKVLDMGLASYTPGGYNHIFEFDPGKNGNRAIYHIVPQFQLMGGRLTVNKWKEISLDPARFDISERAFNVGGKAGYLDNDEYVYEKEITIIPNMPNWYYTTGADWLDLTWIESENLLYVKWSDLPDEVSDRTGVIHVIGKSRDDRDTLIIDSIVVTQIEPQIEIEPEQLKFTKDGGTKTVQIVKCNLKDINVSTKDDYLHLTFENNVITVVADPNNEADDRYGSVTITGMTSTGKQFGRTFDVIVYGTGVYEEPKPVNPAGESPFDFINFWTTFWVQAQDTLVQVSQAFKFEDSNGTMTVTEDEFSQHYVCEGYLEEMVGSTYFTKRAGALTFDILKATGTVQNLRFFHNQLTEQDYSILGVSAHFSTHSVASMSFGDFNLTTDYNDVYMQAKVYSSEGLTFTDFQMQVDVDGTYDDPEISPSHTETPYTFVNDNDNFVWLIINYKDKEQQPIEMGWPSEAVMFSVEEGGMPIHRGETPVNVEGTYAITPLSVVNDQFGEPIAYPQTLIIKLSSQQGGKLKYDSYYIEDGETWPADGDQDALIMGNADDGTFTICVPIEGAYTLISGQIFDGVMIDLHVANVTPKAGQYVIIKDGDGNCPKTTWSPGTWD